jgi:hypothetical protein
VLAEEVRFGRSPDRAHYAVGGTLNWQTNKWNRQLWRVKSDGNMVRIACEGFKQTRNYEKNTVRSVVPRSCIPKAPDALRFWAASCSAGCDEVAVTKRFARG